jgi:hypothetical protein
MSTERISDRQISAIVALVQGIDGYPQVLPVEQRDAIFLALQNAPAAIFHELKERVTFAEKRPTAGTIRRWATELIPPPVYKGFDKIDPLPALPAPGQSYVGGPGAQARAIIDNVRRRAKADGGSPKVYPKLPPPGSGEWGLRYLYCTGKVDYFPCRYSKEDAEALAAEKQTRLVGLKVTAYHVSAAPAQATGFSSIGGIAGATLDSQIPGFKDKPKSNRNGNGR